MGYLDCVIYGFKGFLILFGFGGSILLTVVTFGLICSLLGIGKHKKGV